MALGRVILAVALSAAVLVMLVGNVRCSDPTAGRPATETPPPPTPPPATSPPAAAAPEPALDPAPTAEPSEPAEDERLTVTLGDRTFRLELAVDAESRTRGLMDRESIDPDGGMLFAFPDVAMRSFWMKNCLTDMDIAFLDGSGRITAMHTMRIEPPQRPEEPEWAYEWRLRGYSSLRPAQFAIEVAPGTLEELGLRRGDQVPLDWAALKRRAR